MNILYSQFFVRYKSFIDFFTIQIKQIDNNLIVDFLKFFSKIFIFYVVTIIKLTNKYYYHFPRLKLNG